MTKQNILSRLLVHSSLFKFYTKCYYHCAKYYSSYTNVVPTLYEFSIVIDQSDLLPVVGVAALPVVVMRIVVMPVVVLPGTD